MTPPSSSPALFCFGLGYSARALAAALQAEGWTVAGTNRSAPAAGPATTTAETGAGAIPCYRFDGTAPLADSAARLAGVSHILISAPPDEVGDPVLRWHAADLAARAGNIRWIGYLSTTGVYGDRDGGWVDEQSALTPTGERGRRRVAAEAAWLALGREAGLPVHLFRLAGIYGPGRSALDTVRAGRAQRIDKPGQVFSRIHVADIAQVLRASIDRPNPGAAYNVCDDEPAPPHQVIADACALLGVTPPPLVPFDQAAMSAMARSFYDDNKRVRNDRIKTELGVRLRFPDYRSGLKAQLQDEAGATPQVQE